MTLTLTLALAPVLLLLPPYSCPPKVAEVEARQAEDEQTMERATRAAEGIEGALEARLRDAQAPPPPPGVPSSLPAQCTTLPLSLCAMCRPC